MRAQNPYKQKRRQNRHRMSRKARLAAQALHRRARFTPPPINQPFAHLGEMLVGRR